MMSNATRRIATLTLLLASACTWSIAHADDEESKESKRMAAESAGESPKKEPAFTKSFGEEKSDLVSVGRNPWFVLEPGWVQVFEGDDDGGKAKLVITVLDETKMVDGVETRVVEERETVNGEIEEISLNYFAISKRTNNVYYFGEATGDYKDGKVTTTSGSWEAGKDGAQYGLLLPAVPLIGAKYYQEIAPKEAMDRAEIISLDEKMTTPMGEFKNVMKTRESSPLDPGVKEYKFYAPGVGLLKDGAMKLVSAGMKK